MIQTPGGEVPHILRSGSARVNKDDDPAAMYNADMAEVKFLDKLEESLFMKP